MLIIILCVTHNKLFLKCACSKKSSWFVRSTDTTTSSNILSGLMAGIGRFRTVLMTLLFIGAKPGSLGLRMIVRIIVLQCYSHDLMTDTEVSEENHNLSSSHAWELISEWAE